MSEKWLQFGKRAGYPQCCITAFVYRNENDIPLNNIQKKVAGSSGFIPCVACSLKVLSKQCKLEDLIVNRKCRKPFPLDDFVYYGGMCNK